MGFFYFLNKFQPSKINILEIRFGTGLNALITLIDSRKREVTTNYTGVEAYPAVNSEINQLNYWQQLKTSKEDFLNLHSSPWEIEDKVISNFTVLKRNQNLPPTEIVRITTMSGCSSVKK